MTNFLVDVQKIISKIAQKSCCRDIADKIHVYTYIT